LHRLKLSQGLLLLGKGHDGKSTLINILRACLPPGSTAELDPAMLGAKSATVDLARAALHGKLANLCDDCSAQPWVDTSFLKRVLDHAWVMGRRIGGDPFSFRATLASVFACNELPRVSDKSFGFFRRWLLIHFPNSIPASSRDPRIEQKVLGLEKRELICWFVDAALEMLSEGGPRTFAEPKCHQELLSKWAAGDDSVASFVIGYTEDAGRDKTAWTPTAALYEVYVSWCKWVYGEFRAARQTQSKDAFAKALVRMPGVQAAKVGKANTRVVNRRLRLTEES
jgi:putative DNA primase/helicase